MKKPVIGITMGDPAGIGPEICLRALADRNIAEQCVPVVFGDVTVMDRVASKCGLPANFARIPMIKWNETRFTNGPSVVDCGVIKDTQIHPGRVQALCGKASFVYIRAAIRAALEKNIAGIVTAPIHKTALHVAGKNFPGHTEMLARITGTKRFCMMMASAELKVSLVTCHTGIAHVPGMLSSRRILDVIELTVEMLSKLGIRKPRITVCSLNPHGGENGLFGSEENAVIRPAIEGAMKKGIHVEGPVPPDTAFLPSKRRDTDAYVVMYHDQGLIPFKMLSFEDGVNITLGLPIIRTSVDHGTAFDIAWKGKASAASLVQSILWAVRLAEGSAAELPAKRRR